MCMPSDHEQVLKLYGQFQAALLQDSNTLYSQMEQQLQQHCERLALHPEKVKVVSNPQFGSVSQLPQDEVLAIRARMGQDEALSSFINAYNDLTNLTHGIASSYIGSYMRGEHARSKDYVGMCERYLDKVQAYGLVNGRFTAEQQLERIEDATEEACRDILGRRR